MARFHKFKILLYVMAMACMLAVDAHSTERSPGYWYDSSDHVLKNNYGQCWRAGYWTPSMANAECDPDLVKKAEKKPEARKQDTVPATPLLPNLGPDKPAIRSILQAEILFDFNKASLRAAAKKLLDAEIVEKMKSHPEVELILVTGHASRIGTDMHNRKLSEKRADEVKAYLVSQGVEDSRIETDGKGEAEPIVDCKSVKGLETPKNKQLVACLSPNDRVVLEVKIRAPARPSAKQDYPVCLGRCISENGSCWGFAKDYLARCKHNATSRKTKSACKSKYGNLTSDCDYVSLKCKKECEQSSK